MVEPILSVEGLNKRFGGLAATDNVSLSVPPGTLHAIIGPNGAGKTTLIAQLMGALRPDSGRIVFQGEDVTALATPARVRLGMARSYQVTSLCPDFSVLENVLLASQLRDGGWLSFWRPAIAYPRARSRAMEELSKVGLADRSDRLAGELSHGEQRQLEVAMALASDPVLMLLDEPLAGLGRDEADGMVSLLHSLKGHVTMLLIEHDMEAVFALADCVSVLSFGRIIASGTVNDIRKDPNVRDAYLGTEGEAHA
ncbi:ABC transporter ATP-binding protein [Pacificispira sp.]|uniref:ABC transporter ATP-binding protein n=1 Tax=Pacificispira sp. TaxID=2888761 RepID=UPI003BA89195